MKSGIKKAAYNLEFPELGTKAEECKFDFDEELKDIQKFKDDLSMSKSKFFDGLSLIDPDEEFFEDSDEGFEDLIKSSLQIKLVPAEVLEELD